MLCRITGTIEAITEEGALVIGVEALGVAHEARAPASALVALRERIGELVTLHTLERIEPEAQGAAFTPTLLAFLSEEDRRFFQRFTKVKGLGARKAMRAMAAPTSEIARAITDRDARWLTGLPEIGKRLAETMIAELSGKVDGFLVAPGSSSEQSSASVQTRVRRDAIDAALAAMVRLGESRIDAQQRLDAALRNQPDLDSAEELLAAAYSGEPIHDAG